MRAASIALAVGAAVMSIELAAVRLMAPHFGDSAYVWTNVIGVILVAIAVGAWLGGRASVPGAVVRRLRAVLVAGGVLVALVPLVADPVGRWLLPPDLPLEAAMGALVRASLAATLVLFAVPVLLAAMATPMLVTAMVAGGSAVGRASGHVAAWSTLGSLLGTFATTHVLVPGIGSRATLLCCAAVLVAGGVLTRPHVAAAALLLIPGVAGFLAPEVRRAAPPGMRTIAQVESAYQFLSVARSDAEPTTTWLQINEGLDSFHSIAIEGSPYSGGAYYDYFAAVPFLRTDGAADGPPLRVLSLGAACGTFERMLAHVWPDSELVSVELDPAVVDLAEAHFGGIPAETIVSGLDARVFVEHATERWDVVLVDAYERQIYIPAHVASVEFFRAVRERLEPGGIVAVNSGGLTFDDPVVEVVATTMASVFGAARAFRVPRSRNFMILGRRDAAIELDGLAGGGGGDDTLAGILAAVARPSAWRVFDGDGPVLTDDRPFLDRVQDAALRGAPGAATPIPMAGSTPTSEAEQAAWEALRDEDLRGLDAALRSAAAPSTALRLYAGDFRWLSHDLAGARVEYRAGLALTADGQVGDSLRARLEDLDVELSGFERAESITARNTWVAGAVAAGLLAALGLVMRVS